MKFDTNIDITKHFVEEAYGVLNEEVISFVDYKKDLYDLNLFLTIFNEYIIDNDTSRKLINNFMANYKKWDYYMIKNIFKLLLNNNLIKENNYE